MTVQRITYSKDYVQDEHQREVIELSNAIDNLQAAVTALQKQVAQLQSFNTVITFPEST